MDANWLTRIIIVSARVISSDTCHVICNFLFKFYNSGLNYIIFSHFSENWGVMLNEESILSGLSNKLLVFICTGYNETA